MIFSENTDELVSNSLSIKIPYEFIDKITNLSWKELYYGFKCGYVLPESGINKAVQLLEHDESSTILNLASLYKDEEDKVENFLIELAKAEEFQSIGYIKEKWLYIVLSWLYINQNQYNTLYAEIPYPVNNIYEKVNIIWDDFNHPDVLQFLFINNEQNNYERIEEIPTLEYFYNSWNEYLRKQKEYYKK